VKRILAATDFSSRALVAVRRAAVLAKEHAAELELCHAVDDDQPERLRQLAMDASRQALDALPDEVAELKDLSVEMSVILGDAFEAIIAAADAKAADLIVIGAHRRLLLRDLFVGTTAERIMGRGTRPVLMANVASSVPYRHILAAIDMSECAAQALKRAYELGLFRNARLTVFHAFDGMVTTLASASVSPDVLRERLEQSAAQATKDVEQFLAGIGLEGVSYTIRVDEGTPVFALLRAVEKLSPDLVLIGTRGRTGGLARLILGSVAVEIIREIDTDILAVPPAAES
jgi:nucleotide-binding universal stress UspA family protein